MLVECKGYLMDVVKKESNSHVYLNGKLRSNPFDYQYLNCGLRVSLDSLDLESEHTFVLDISQSFKDVSGGGKQCFTHINVVGVR